MSIHLLAGLLDEKLIKIMSLFLKYPERGFYMSEVSKLSRINNATTFRTLNKLVNEGFITATVIGKVRTYKLSTSEKAKALAELLRREVVYEQTDALADFCERVKQIPRIREIILEHRTPTSAKLIIVDDYPSRERLERISKEIEKRNNFLVTFVELSPAQYEGLRQSIGKDKKILFKRSQ